MTEPVCALVTPQWTYDASMDSALHVLVAVGFSGSRVSTTASRGGRYCNTVSFNISLLAEHLAWLVPEGLKWSWHVLLPPVNLHDCAEIANISLLFVTLH